MTPMMRLNTLRSTPVTDRVLVRGIVCWHGLWICLTAICLWGLAIPGQADVLSNLYSFTGGADGASPNGLIQATDGNLYGTCQAGGSNGAGTIFMISSGVTSTTLYTFTGGADGASPNGLIQAIDGNLYGTCQAGGSNGAGTIFMITTGGAFTTLYTFSALSSTGTNTDGAHSFAPLLQATDGNLYGTCYDGGINATGTIFMLTTAGAFTPLYSFSTVDVYGTNSDGAHPQAALIQANDGNLYGSGYAGGAQGVGTLFKITPTGTFSRLHNFAGGGYGAYPQAALIQANDGNLYGTCQDSNGDIYAAGTIFKITLKGVYHYLYVFPISDGIVSRYGANPNRLIQASDGNLYGSCSEGGSSGNNDGTLFKITPAGTFTLLYSLSATTTTGPQEANPNTLIMGNDGNLYGSCAGGDASGNGTVFSLSIAPPTITSLNPTSVQANTAFTLTLTGASFVPRSIVKWNGTALTTHYMSGSQLSAVVTTRVNTPLTTYPGAAQISVVNPDKTTGNASLALTVPTPVLKSLSPSSLPHGSATSTLTLTGVAFTPGAVVNWNSTTLTTTFVSTSKLTATIPASDLATKGKAQVSVTNPGGGGTSQALTFTIN